jgi:DNA-binding IclR family transcriptional regulator
MFYMENPVFDGRNSRGGVPAIERAMRVLDAVASGHGAAGVSGLARATGLSKSSVHALLVSMLDHGMLDREGDVLVPGGRLVEIGAGALGERARVAGRRAVAELAAETGETSFFGEVRGTKLVILERASGRGALSLSAPVGMELPLVAGAHGIAYLSTLQPDDARSFLARHPFRKRTTGGVVDVETVLAAACRAATHGYATERGDYLEGIAAAASIFSIGGRSYALWSVAIDAAIGEEGLIRIGGAVRDTALRAADAAATTGGQEKHR